MMALLVFTISFVQNYIATQEIAAISKTDKVKATLWAGVNSTVGLVFAIMMIERMDRWHLIAPYTFGNMLATYFALRKSK
jgi:hypothetical protein